MKRISNIGNRGNGGMVKSRVFVGFEKIPPFALRNIPVTPIHPQKRKITLIPVLRETQSGRVLGA